MTSAYRQLIEASPLVALAAVGPEGLDCSWRGDRGQAVVIRDARTLEMPDRHGNNRIDSLKKIVRDPRVALVFLIPGANITLRMNGHASVVVEPGLLDAYAVDGKQYIVVAAGAANHAGELVALALGDE